MTPKFAGWVMFIAALGMMSGLLAVDVSKLSTFHEMATPSFVGELLGHFGAVIAAFIGGKLIPTGVDTTTVTLTKTTPTDPNVK